MRAKMLRTCIALLGLTLPGLALAYTNIFLVGDSLSDQGNLFAATTSVGGPALPASDHYFDRRFSNGPIYADIVAQRLNLPLGPSFEGGNNFAYGGARTTYNIVESSAGGVLPPGLFPWSLNSEVDAFKQRNIHDPGALYIVFSGANDIADLVRSGGANAPGVLGGLLGGVISAIDAFKDAGARTILVPNVPDLGLTPAFGLNPNPAAAAAATFFSAEYNKALAAALLTVSDVDIIELDTFSLVRDIAANPEAFDLQNVTHPCYSGFVAPNPAGTECGNPQDFFFWDVVHPTTAVHRILAEAVLAAVVPAPSTLTLLALALVTLAGFNLRRLPGAY
jgi:outer membrane lipase/esterase